MRRTYSLFLSRTEPVSYEADTFESGAMDASSPSALDSCVNLTYVTLKQISFVLRIGQT
jgi:hypothetical protein